MSNRKTWISILIAAVIVVGIIAVSAVGGTAYFIYRHVHTQFVPDDNAARQFQDARAILGPAAAPRVAERQRGAGAASRSHPQGDAGRQARRAASPRLRHACQQTG